LALLKAIHLEGARLLPYLDSVFSANSLAIQVDERQLGVFGQLDPRLCENMGTEEALFALDLDVEALLQAGAGLPRYRAFSRQPSVWRDVNLLCDASSQAGAVADTLLEAGQPLLKQVQLVDLYQGQGVPEGQVSRSYRLWFNDAERSLNDGDVDPVMERLLKEADSRHGARLRS
jgi:phenylalanyl-tRNA synthetase beta chain